MQYENCSFAMTEEWALSLTARARLREAVDRWGSMSKLAQHVGMPRPTLVKILNGDGDVGVSRLAAIASAVGVTLDYIVNGDGPAGELVGIRKATALASAGSGAEPPLVEFDGEVPFPKAWIRAEFGDPAKLAMMQVSGDSMAPTINDGEWVLFDISRRGPADGIYVILVEGVLLVKRLQFTDRRIFVYGDMDPTHGVLLNAEDLEQTTINKVIGRVLWSGRMFL